MTNWFAGYTSQPDVLKSRYRLLAMQYHPDHGGDTATMQEIIAAYEAELKAMNGVKYVGTDNKERTYYYNAEVEREIMGKIDELLRAKLPRTVNILILGTWVWVEGTDKDDMETREKLTTAKMRWNPERQAWSWHDPRQGKYRPNPRVSFEDMKSMFNAIEVDRSAEDEQRQSGIRGNSRGKGSRGGRPAMIGA